MIRTVRTLQVVYFSIAILSFLVIIYLNLRKIQELEKNKTQNKTQQENGTK